MGHGQAPYLTGTLSISILGNHDLMGIFLLKITMFLVMFKLLIILKDSNQAG